MTRKLYLVDYKENGQNKWQAIEASSIGCVTDSEIVQMLHFYIGKYNQLSCVAEFTTDMPFDEFFTICNTERVLEIPRRVLYVNMDEVMRDAKLYK